MCESGERLANDRTQILMGLHNVKDVEKVQLQNFISVKKSIGICACQ